MTTTKKFNPPANISDFDSGSPLLDDWNEKLSNRFEFEVQSLIDDVNVQPNQIVFFNPLKTPSGQVSVAHITWGGFPNVLIARFGKQRALQMADSLRSFTAYEGPNGGQELNFSFRPQDEYLEWIVKRDENTGKIKEIVFTCEGPEYWETLSQDPELLLRLYKLYAGPEVTLTDLLHSQDVYERNENNDLERVYRKDEYNRWNKWNLSSAIHLTHPSNTLFAEINLAARSTVSRKRGEVILTDAHDLICCSGYGAPNRNSDPTIGSVANSAAREGNWVSLHDPVGLYISGINPSQFTKPDGSAIPDFESRYWNIIRSSNDDKMILRASVKVPENEMFNGKRLLLGDLLVNGDPLQYGGQVADTVTVGLYADVVPDGPQATGLPCPFKCCIDRTYPNIDNVVEINQDCATVPEAFALGETGRMPLPFKIKGYARAIIIGVENNDPA
jgi:hypothetical protein